MGCKTSPNQLINQSINRAINQTTNQSENQSTNQSINQASKQSLTQSTNQPINQSITWLGGRIYIKEAKSLGVLNVCLLQHVAILTEVIDITGSNLS